MNLLKATPINIKDIMKIMSEARGAQRAAGFVQWKDNYPSADIIESDIADGTGYILDDGGHIAGYVAIAFSDSEYDRHRHLWDTEVKYAVMHRIAIGDNYRGKGCSRALFDLSESLVASKGVRYIRIDTGIDNRPMQHILSSRNYTCLGECDFVWGPRLAYEKKI